MCMANNREDLSNPILIYNHIYTCYSFYQYVDHKLYNIVTFSFSQVATDNNGTWVLCNLVMVL